MNGEAFENVEIGENGVEDRLAAATWRMLRESGAFLRGHFLLSSGRHSEAYLQCARLLAHPRRATFVGEALAALVEPLEIQVVVSPALGGLIVGQEVARALGVPHLFYERPEGTFTLRRFEFPEGKRVLVVEDVITTGKSTREVGEALRSGGAVWVGAAALVDRSGGAAHLPFPPVALCAADVPTYDPSECPLCREGTPVIKPGSRPAAPA
jgi:orotate phosphoribosyltransferase